MDGMPERRVFGNLVADDNQLHLFELRAPPQLVEGFDRPLEVLVRFDVARIEDEWMVELITFADPSDVFLRWWRAELLVEAVVDHVDLRGRYVEVPEDVLL